MLLRVACPSECSLRQSVRATFDRRSPDRMIHPLSFAGANSSGNIQSDLKGLAGALSKVTKTVHFDVLYSHVTDRSGHVPFLHPVFAVIVVVSCQCIHLTAHCQQVFFSCHCAGQGGPQHGPQQSRPCETSVSSVHAAVWLLFCGRDKHSQQGDTCDMLLIAQVGCMSSRTLQQSTGNPTADCLPHVAMCRMGGQPQAQSAVSVGLG